MLELQGKLQNAQQTLLDKESLIEKLTASVEEKGSQNDALKKKYEVEKVERRSLKRDLKLAEDSISIKKIKIRTLERQVEKLESSKTLENITKLKFRLAKEIDYYLSH